jgi:hypothetical protein
MPAPCTVIPCNYVVSLDGESWKCVTNQQSSARGNERRVMLELISEKYHKVVNP